MPRPGFVLEVDERTPPLLVHEGERYRMQKFPLGTRVVYPPDSLPGFKDLNAHIRHALLHPVGDSKPLPELLFAGMKLTIAVDDISIPLPPMVTPDIRQRILEHVIELAASKGVEDLEIVVAAHQAISRVYAAKDRTVCEITDGDRRIGGDHHAPLALDEREHFLAILPGRAAGKLGTAQHLGEFGDQGLRRDEGEGAIA